MELIHTGTAISDVNLDKYSAVNKKWKERKKSETSVITDLITNPLCTVVYLIFIDPRIPVVN
jgi:hypothetical protein